MLEAAQAEGEDEHSEEWLDTFSQEAEKTTTLELAEAEEEEGDSMSFVDLCEQIQALERRVIVQGMHIQQVRLETDEEDDMGNHCDLPICRNFLQLRRLQE